MTMPGIHYPQAEVLPLDGARLDQVQLLVVGYLARYKGTTRRTYAGVINRWITWCHRYGVSPLDVQRAHIELWARQLEARAGQPQPVPHPHRAAHRHRPCRARQPRRLRPVLLARPQRPARLGGVRDPPRGHRPRPRLPHRLRPPEGRQDPDPPARPPHLMGGRPGDQRPHPRPPPPRAHRQPDGRWLRHPLTSWITVLAMALFVAFLIGYRMQRQVHITVDHVNVTRDSATGARAKAAPSDHRRRRRTV
jgi:hypothetical protein